MPAPNYTPLLPILCFSTTDWDEIWGSRQQIMLRLAQRGHPVLFVERQVGPEQLLGGAALRKRKIESWKGNRLQLRDKNLWIWQPPLLPPGRYYSNVLNRWGQRLLAMSVLPVLNELGLQQPILWVYPPQSAPLIGRFEEKLVVYHCIEHFSGIQRNIKRKVMQAQEAELLRRADVVLTHSTGLKQRYQGFTKRPIVVTPSAADVGHFQSTTAIHPTLEPIPHPRVGLVGTLDDRIDISLLEFLAESQPDWHLILLGSIRPGRADFHKLLSYTNVHYLGAQSYADLPLLLNGLDVCLIPYVLNEMTEYISPLKLYEYLAAGKPIVSARMPEVDILGEYVNIAGTPEEFRKAIAIAFTNENPELQVARRKAAWQHTWEARLQVMWEAIQSVIAEKSHASS